MIPPQQTRMSSFGSQDNQTRYTVSCNCSNRNKQGFTCSLGNNQMDMEHHSGRGRGKQMSFPCQQLLSKCIGNQPLFSSLANLRRGCLHSTVCLIRHLIVWCDNCGKNRRNNKNYTEIELLKIFHRLSYFTFFFFCTDKASKFQITSIRFALINKLIHQYCIYIIYW